MGQGGVKRLRLLMSSRKEEETWERRRGLERKSGVS